MKHDVWGRVAEYIGVDLTDHQTDLLGLYRDWLLTEAIPAGGLGPDEVDRLDRRHIADSLLFAAGFGPLCSVIRDLGSGVGLPGIPLAIMFPETQLELIDRSGRRVDLMKRVVRVLDLRNVDVVQTDFTANREPCSVIVSRASLPPDLMSEVAGRQLTPGGVMVLGGSWVEKPRHPGWETLEIPATMLDQPVWLLIMRRQ